MTAPPHLAGAPARNKVESAALGERIFVVPLDESGDEYFEPVRVS
jgi:hypothetical protein